MSGRPEDLRAVKDLADGRRSLPLGPLSRVGLALGGIGVIAAAGAHVWARHIEIHRFTLRTVDVPLAALTPGSDPIRLLHISDIHLMPGDRRKAAFLRDLADLSPDVVVDTGDNIASPASLAPLGAALAPLLAVPGAFVMGSNDMYAPAPKNPLRYFKKDPRPEGLTTRRPPRDLPTNRLAALLSRDGWHDLTNRRARTDLPGVEIRWVGVDDPHLEMDEMPTREDSPRAGSSSGSADPAGGTPERPVLRIGVAHAPYRRVLDEFVADGCDLVLAGHTHGGQLRVPGFGALVTNCDLPRPQARGLSSWHGVPLHVSGGLGASPYSNYRFANPPEATLLTLRPAAG